MPTTPSARPPLIAIIGPTAVGKTRLSLDLATTFDGEIVNADSRSFYRGMDIGTAKVEPAERARIPHHLIDILHPNDPVSLAMFQDLAYAAIDDINARRRIPFLVGGTPQYVNAIIEGWQIPRVEPDPELRAALEAYAHEHGREALQARLHAVDSVAAHLIGPNTRRIIRALEVYEKTGRPISEQQGKGPARYRSLELALTRPRAELHRRIDDRAREQIAIGLVDEIRGLLRDGVDPDSPSFASIGYRQLMPYIRGEMSLEDALQRIMYDTHRLVRQQETWWRKNDRLIRLDMTDPNAHAEAERIVRAFLRQS